MAIDSISAGTMFVDAAATTMEGTTPADGQPGFGPGLALVALLAALGIARVRREFA